MEGRTKDLMAARPKGARVVACTVFAVAMTLAPPGAHAQAAQTAEGAQKFLASVARNGNVQAYVVGDVKVVHSCMSTQGPCSKDFLTMKDYPIEEIRRYDGDVSTIEQVETACRTRATSYPVRVSVHDVDDVHEKHRFHALAEPVVLVADVDWSKATIKRGNWWRSPTEFLGQTRWRPDDSRGLIIQYGNPNKMDTSESGIHAIAFVSEDPEMLDRIEYATKFLKMSCDKTADTGF